MVANRAIGRGGAGLPPQSSGSTDAVLFEIKPFQRAEGRLQRRLTVRTHTFTILISRRGAYTLIRLTGRTSMRQMILSGALIVSGCNMVPSITNQTAANQPPATTRDLLMQGSAQVCSQQDVRDTVLSFIKPKEKDGGMFYNIQDFQSGVVNLTYNIDTIALAGVDKSINSVSCDGNVIIHYKDHEDKTFTVRYVVRPSVEDQSSFVVNTSAGDATEYAAKAASDAAMAVGTARVAAQQQQAQAQQQAQEAQQAQQQADAMANAADTAQPSSTPETNNLPTQ